MKQEVVNIKYLEIFDLIKNSNKIVFFGGAGVSTASGIPDYRSVDGLYSSNYQHPPEVILSHRFFFNETKEFFKFYYDKMIHIKAKPNYCHLALVKLEEKGQLLAIVTQNIDGLHQLAGSQKVYELHGSIHRNYSVKSNRFYSLEYILNNQKDGIPLTEDGELIKPDVVLYEEPLDSEVLNGAIEAIAKADLLIIGGTSLTVYPASGLINYYQGKNVIIINKEPLINDLTFQINDDINLVFKKYLEYVGEKL